MLYDSVDKRECNAEKETEIYTHAVKNQGLNIKDITSIFQVKLL